MNILLRYPLAAGLCLAAFAAGAHTRPIEGFGAYNWGDAPVYPMDSIAWRRGMEVFYRPADFDRPVAGVGPASVEYLYKQNGLCRVEVNWRQRLNKGEVGKVLASLSESWGAPDANRSGRYRWLSEEGEVEAELSPDGKAALSGIGQFWRLAVQDPDCAPAGAAAQPPSAPSDR